MKSFIDLKQTFSGQPADLGPMLARIDTGRGREQLYQDQMPEVLRQLSEHARVASIEASTAIEGIHVDPDRAARIAGGTPRLRNRNEKEFAGYRDAVDWIVRSEEHELLSVPFALHLHRLLFHHAGGRGGCLKTEENLIVSYEDGHRQVVFTPPPPDETEFLLRELFERYNKAKLERRAHPLLLIGALVVDFLAIHPVADGNGRLARLLTTHELLAEGYGIARYISIEQRIYSSKNTYYASLYDSQLDWHEVGHIIWPWVSYLVRILEEAYDDFEQRVAAAGAGGNKQQRVNDYILHQAPREFRRRDIERALPGISLGTIRLVLNDLRDSGVIRSKGAGPTSSWERVPT